MSHLGVHWLFSVSCLATLSAFCVCHGPQSVLAHAARLLAQQTLASGSHFQTGFFLQFGWLSITASLNHRQRLGRPGKGEPLDFGEPSSVSIRGRLRGRRPLFGPVREKGGCSPFDRTDSNSWLPLRAKLGGGGNRLPTLIHHNHWGSRLSLPLPRLGGLVCGSKALSPGHHCCCS